MKDIFLSYKKLDAERVRVLVDAFERSGFTVWWDRAIPAGKSWAEVIEEAITSCRCVVVVWSENSVGAEWVHKEARKGEQRGNLIPVMIDAVQPPFEFEHLQAANLVGWDGVSTHDQYEQLVERIEAVIEAQHEGAGEKAVEAARARKAVRSRSQLMRRATAVIAVAISLAVAAAVLLAPSGSVELELEDLRLSGVRFELSPEERGGSESVLLLEAVPVDEIVAYGLKSLELPASAEGSGGTFADDPLVALATLEPASTEAVRQASTLDIGGLELSAGAILELQRTISGYQLAVRGAEEELGITVSGRVLVAVVDEDTLDFGPGGGVRLRPEPGGLTLEFRPIAGDLPLFENVVIDDLRLYRVDQDVDLDATSVDVVSTVQGGRLNADWMGEPRELDSGELIRFDSFNGEINSLRLVGDTIVLSASGRAVSGLRTGAREEGRDLMPTLLGSFSMTGKLLVILVAIVYLVGLIMLIRRLWRRTI